MDQVWPNRRHTVVGLGYAFATPQCLHHSYYPRFLEQRGLGECGPQLERLQLETQGGRERARGGGKGEPPGPPEGDLPRRGRARDPARLEAGPASAPAAQADDLA